MSLNIINFNEIASPDLSELYLKRGNFLDISYYFIFNTASYAEIRIPLCRMMLKLNLALLRLWDRQSERSNHQCCGTVTIFYVSGSGSDF
jgi:hypothetical protein